MMRFLLFLFSLTGLWLACGMHMPCAFAQDAAGVKLSRRMISAEPLDVDTLASLRKDLEAQRI